MSDDDSANAAEKAVAKAYEKLDNAWFRGLLQGIPGVGGTLDTWFFQVAEKAKAQRIHDALEDVQSRVGKLETDDRYVKEHVEEFAYLTEKGFINIAQDYREEMRSAYVRMLARFYSKEFSQLENKELYLQYLSTLSPIHLVVLKHLADGFEENGVLKSQPQESVQDKLSELVGSGIDPTLAYSLVNDLVTRGMLTHTQTSAIGGDVHTYSITDLGKTMLKLIEE